MMAGSALPNVIIGDGLVGWAVAYELARLGAPVMVIEAGLHGSASLAAAGMITPGTVANLSPGYLALAIAAAANFSIQIAELEEAGFGPTGFSQPGGLVIAQAADEEPWLDQVEQLLVSRRVSGMAMIGEAQRLSAAECRSLAPILSPDLAGGVWYRGGAQVIGRDLRLALRTAALAHGAMTITSRASLEQSGTNITIRLDDNSRITPESLVVAAGAWSAQLLAGIGIELPIRPQRGQLVHLGWSQNERTCPVIETRSHHYLLRFPDRIVIGATREESGFMTDPTPRGMQDVLGHALAIAPSLASAPILETRVGIRPLSPDGLPVIGRVPHTENTWICAGHGPLGLTLGWWTAKMLANAITGQSAEPSLDGYAPDRFDRDRPN